MPQSIPLVNLYAKGKTVYLFERQGDKQVIRTDATLSPCYYEPDDKGSYTGYDGTKLKRIETINTFETKKYRSCDSFSSDIPFEKQYLINAVDTIEKSNIKYLFLDIEVYAKTIPDVNTANQPVSCVSIYN